MRSGPNIGTGRAITDAEKIQRIGVVGGGLIGQSWASLCAAFELDVVVYDPNPGIKAELEAFVRKAWPNQVALGLAHGDAPAIPAFTTELADLRNVDFVQENVPDRIGVKRAVIEALEDVIGERTVIASSTSALLASDIQDEACWPARILVGHPMNPPHLIPLVELVAGRATSPDVVDLAEAFYARLKRLTVRVKKEAVGHLANRLTAALYREAVYIAAEGIADVADIDRAIACGPGLRWALMGPHLTYHLGGGKGGYRHYLDHLGASQEARWRDLGAAELTEEVKDILVAGIAHELEDQDAETLAARRDAALVDLQNLKKIRGF